MKKDIERDIILNTASRLSMSETRVMLAIISINKDTKAVLKHLIKYREDKMKLVKQYYKILEHSPGSLIIIHEYDLEKKYVAMADELINKIKKNKSR